MGTGVLIFLDVERAKEDGITIKIRNGTDCSIFGCVRGKGLKNYVNKVLKAPDMTLLFQSNEDPNIMTYSKTKSRDQKIVHATYWENLHGILTDGIIPNKNPRGDRAQIENLDDHEGFVHCAVGAPGVEIPGMRRKPDVYLVIEGDDLDVLHPTSSKDGTVLIEGKIDPKQVKAVPAPFLNEHDIDDKLKGKIANPKNFEEIPILDLSLSEAEIVEGMRYAASVVGFLTVMNHGVDPDILAKFEEGQRKFFAQDQATKNKLQMTQENPLRGYFGFGTGPSENLDSVAYEDGDTNKEPISRKDQKEGFDMAGGDLQDGKSNYFAMKHPTTAVAELEEVIGPYTAELRKLGKRLMRYVALAFPEQFQDKNKKGDFFEEFMDQTICTQRMLHYPEVKKHRYGVDMIGAGPHADYGLLTILRQDSVGGLQVLNWKGKQWVHATPVQDSYVINFADLLSTWSRGTVKSTIHRVVHLSCQSRYSAPFFISTNPDTNIADTSKGEEPLTCLENLLRCYTQAGLLKVGKHEHAWKAK